MKKPWTALERLTATQALQRATMQRDYLPAVPESCGMSSERLQRISAMLEGMVADESACPAAARCRSHAAGRPA